MAEKQTTLDTLEAGQSAKISKVLGEGALRQRLLDMGLTQGTAIEVIKASPLGDPIEYRVRGYNLSLRKSEAETIEVDL